MRHRNVVFLLIALLLASTTTVSVSNEGAPQISDQIEVDAAPIWSEMDITLGPQRYWFTASDSKPYTIIAESYQAQLTVWIATADGKTLQTAELTKEGQFRYRTTIDTEKGARYQIGVAVADDAPARIGYRLGLYSSTKAELPQDARLHIVNLHTVDTFISSFTLSESQALYLHHPARFFQLHLEDKEGQWIVAKVSAHAFIPRVHLLNSMNQAVIGDDDASYSVRKKQSRERRRSLVIQ